MQQLFEAYVRKLDRRFEQQNRRVLLFVDNCAAHGHIKNLKAVQIEFLPPNTTAILQPMDQCVIRNLKHHYKSRVLSHMVLCSDSGKSYAVDLRSAVGMLAESWKAVTQETLRNCFRHTGFTLDAAAAVSPQVDSMCDELPSADVAFDDLRAAGVSIPEGITFEGFANADKDLELCAELTDDEIIRQVTEDSDDSDTENEEPAPTQPTSSELTRALMTLSSVYSGNMTLNEIEADMIAGKRNAVQKKISDFFAPKC